MDGHVVGYGTDGTEPYIFFRNPFIRFERIDRIDVADLDGFVTQDLFPDTGRDVFGQFPGHLDFRFKPSGPRASGMSS